MYNWYFFQKNPAIFRININFAKFTKNWPLLVSRRNNFELLVALKNGGASGLLFWDDGESIDSFENQNYQINTFEFNAVSWLFPLRYVQLQTWFIAEHVDDQRQTRIFIFLDRNRTETWFNQRNGTWVETSLDNG